MQMIPSGALRKSILQSAIRGELNPRTADDARQLLAQVIEQRNALALAKWHDNGSKGKPPATIKPSKISPDEIPFQIPENWVWCRLGEVCEVVRGGSPRPAGSNVYYNGNIPFLKVADITKDDSMYVYSAESSIKEAGLSKTRFVKAGTFLISNSGATLGVPKITTFDTTFNDGVAAFLNLKEEIKSYIYYYFCSKTDELRGINQGSTQPNLNTEMLSNLLLPLPPLSEQVAIVEKLEKLQPLLDKYERDTQQVFGYISTASANLKKSILQSAIRGELNPRTSDDARQLLAQVIGQRNALALAKWHDNGSKGKPPATIKPSKISPGEIPFQIPENWVWCRLGEVCEHASGLWVGKKPPYKNVGVIRNANFNKDFTLNTENIAYIDVEEKSFQSRKLEVGDIIIEKSGGGEKTPVGRPVLFELTDGEYSYSNFTEKISLIDKTNILPKYLHYTLVTLYIMGATIELQSNTTNLRNLNMKGFLNLLLPLPPLSEQVAIVEKLEKLQPLLDKYERDTQQVFGRGV